MTAGSAAGPRLPRPTRAQIEFGAALSGAMKLVFDEHPDLFSALGHLLKISPQEAAARFAAFQDHGATCWEIAETWGRERGLRLLGYAWDGDDEPSFHWVEAEDQ